MGLHGKQIADLCIFVGCLLLFALYHFYYFLRGKLPGHSKSRALDLWTTAKKTRTLWADDIMLKADDSKGEALLAVQTMRNIIVAATLLVMGMSQIMGRLVNIMCTQPNLQTLEGFAQADPITDSDGSFSPAYARVAVPFGFTLLALLSFAQCVRLAVHLGFCIRVAGVYPNTDMPLREEIISMTERCSLYFTLGLRFLYAFIAFVWWMVGTTPLLVATGAVLLLLFFSDQITTEGGQHAEKVRGLTKYADKYRQQKRSGNGSHSSQGNVGGLELPQRAPGAAASRRTAGSGQGGWMEDV